MRHRKKMISFLSVFLIALLLGVLLVCTDELSGVSDQAETNMTFAIRSGEKEELISGWKDSEGNYYVFLPAYAEMEDVFLAHSSNIAAIAGASAESGMPCSSYELEKAYSLTFTEESSAGETTLIFVRSSGVPALYIDVQSGDMEYIHMEKGNQEPGAMRLYDAGGEMQYSGLLESVKGRGNSSWGAAKKPYNLKLEESADLLKMGAAKNWTLLSEGYNELNIRNKIVYEFADAAGLLYSPDCEWVSLYMNGTYMGLYLLSERNEVHPERVNIPEQGSFLISMESKGNLEKQKIPYLDVGSNQVLRVRYTSMDEREIYNAWMALKNALLSENGVDSNTGKHWQELIDMDSWVRKYLIEEVFGNPDGGVLSQFFYVDGADPEKRIAAGPVWDYDYAMGGEDYWMRRYPNYLTLAKEYFEDEMYLPWYYELYQEEVFRSRLSEIYREEFLPVLHSLTGGVIDTYAQRILPAAFCDGIRWGNSADSIESDLILINEFLTQRVAFLEDLWLGDSQYHIVQVYPGRFGEGYLAVRDGEQLPNLPDYESIGGLGWYNADTDEPFDITQPIFEDTNIYVKKPKAPLPMIHYLPVLALAAMLFLLIIGDRIQTRKNGRMRRAAAKVK